MIDNNEVEMLEAKFKGWKLCKCKKPSVVQFMRDDKPYDYYLECVLCKTKGPKTYDTK